MYKEFLKFALRGNVIDLAVGIIIGAAFGRIVTSMVNDVIMPLIGVLTGGINFSELRWVITPAQGDIAELAVRYGAFFQSMVDFFLIALSIFILVKLVSKLRKKQEEAAVELKLSNEEILLTEIRDLLKNR